MTWLAELLAFGAKGVVVTLVFGAIAMIIASLVRRNRAPAPRLEVRQLNERFESLSRALRSHVMDKKAYRAWQKEQPKHEKHAEPKVFVLDFEGDLMATATASLREEITAITSLAKPHDEVVVRLESPGGAVPHYGLAAAQLARLKAHQVKLTVCIDRVAASGGYMMACVADTIIAAPFAIVGSIGVVAQVPNVHKLLKRHDVDYEEMTAGEFKRTVSVFGEISAKGREKFQEQLDETHDLFKEFVKAQRPSLDVEKVATGEYWLGRRTLELGLVDRLGTSDEYLLERAKTASLYRVAYHPQNAWRSRLTRAAGELAEGAVLSTLRRVMSLRLQ
jgi:serine protease SohB